MDDKWSFEKNLRRAAPSDLGGGGENGETPEQIIAGMDSFMDTINNSLLPWTYSFFLRRTPAHRDKIARPTANYQIGSLLAAIHMRRALLLRVLEVFSEDLAKAEGILSRTPSGDLSRKVHEYSEMQKKLQSEFEQGETLREVIGSIGFIRGAGKEMLEAMMANPDFAAVAAHYDAEQRAALEHMRSVNSSTVTAQEVSDQKETLSYMLRQLPSGDDASAFIKEAVEIVRAHVDSLDLPAGNA